MSSMDTVFNCVIPYIQNGDDRNSVSLVCRKWNEIDCFTRKHVTVHLCYAPTPSRVSKRFPYLESLTLKGIKNSDTSIDLTQWIQEIAIKFTCLKSLRFRHLVIRDSDLKLLAKNRGKDLLSLKVCKCKGFSENGLMCVAKYCSELKELCLEEIDLVVGEEEVEEHGKWLRVLALRKTGIEKFSYMNNEVTTFGQEDVFLIEKCRESLVSLRVDSCLINYAALAISNAVNLQDFFGAIFYEEEQYIGFKFPSSIRSLGLSVLPRGSFRFVDPVLNQLRELDYGWIDVPQACRCVFLQSCPNLEALHTEDVCGDTGLELISQVCKKLRKLTVYSGTRVGLMAVAQGCPNLEYLHVKLTDISNEALECIGSNLKNLRVFHIRVDDEEYNTIIPLDNGIRAMLIGCTKLERLGLSINLREEALTDVGLGFIGKYGINLRFLSLAYIGSDEGLRALSMGCPRLRKLEMQGRILSEQAIASFLFNVPSLRYFWALDGYRGALTLPNFGSSTMEAQVPTQLKWHVKLADKLDRLALQLVAGGGSGLKSVKVTYASTTVKIADVESRFVGAISESGDLKVEGTLKYGVPYLTKVGDFEVDVSLEGDIILCRQVDQPGIIGSVGTILGEEKVNVSFMSVGKTITKEAVMTIVVDKKPMFKTLEKIVESCGVNEVVFLAL